MRWLLRLLTVALFAVSLNALLDYWIYDEYAVDIAKLMSRRVTHEQLLQQIDTAIANDRPEEARMYLQLAQRFGYDEIDPATYEATLVELEAPFPSTMRSLSSFANGFIDGNADNSAGIAGAIAADFTVVGDVRDLWDQYQRQQRNEPVNELIVTLAGVGVGLTAATVLSTGVAAPAKAGVSTLKIASRAGHLSYRFQRLLLHKASQVFSHQTFMRTAKENPSFSGVRLAAQQAYNPAAFQALNSLADQANSIRQSTSVLDTVHLLKYVDDTNDLKRIQTLSKSYGIQTKGIMKLLGKSAIGTVRVLRRTIELTLSMLASLVSFFGMIIAWRI